MHLDLNHIIEFAAVLLGLHSVWALTDVKEIGWLTGLLSIGLSASVYLMQQIYGQLGLMAVFAGMSIWGWARWKYGAQDTAFKPAFLTAKEWILSFLLLAVSWYGIRAALQYLGQGHVVELDAFITAGSLVAMVWQAQKKIENWAFWAILNIASISMYWQTGNWAFLLYYAALLLMCFRGFLNWKAMQAPAEPSSR